MIKEQQPDDREAKLPQWAQAKLTALRDALAGTDRERAARDVSEGSDSDIHAVRYSRGGRSVVGLGTGAEIIFDLSNGEKIGVSRAAADGDKLHVYVRTMGRPMIQPEAGNGFTINVKPYRPRG